MDKLGENIRRERVAAKLTQEKLSELAGMDITNLQRIESGRYNTKVTTLIRLRKALHVDWEDLLPSEE
ncbi:transcriptional regulator with XRE-family HTH domain [Puniceicoccus vermicola]|uniref:helix-turn-helix domain-containing protein n=1 Tax=Puniceicoccus vermicola TaxID=388746 RepID=UPI001C8BEB3F|nr:helix-turn-helix transcriptional regulator [Puniceicoccus vermicola]